MFIASEGGAVVALNGATGAVLWNVSLGTAVYSSLTMGANGVVYFGSFDDGVLHGWNATTGSELFTFTSNSQVMSTPTLGSDGTVYFASDDGFLYALHNL